MILNYAAQQGFRDRFNPAQWSGGLEFDLPSVKLLHTVKHYAALPLAEMKRIARLFFHSQSTTKLAVVFGFLTATRANEFTQADWTEIDLDRRVWIIPPKRRKDRNQNPFVVPLSDAAIAVLERLPLRIGPLFPSNIFAPIRRDHPLYVLHQATELPVTMHGCRSTFRDWAAESGEDPIVAEKCLMHSIGNAVVQSYFRSELFKQRQVLLQKWGNIVLSEEARKQDLSTDRDNEQRKCQEKAQIVIQSDDPANSNNFDNPLEYF